MSNVGYAFVNFVEPEMAAAQPTQRGGCETEARRRGGCETERTGRNQFGAIRFGSGLFDNSSVRFGSVRPVRFGFSSLPERRMSLLMEAKALK